MTTTTSSHASVTYRITVRGQEHTATAETNTTGPAAQAALGLVTAIREAAQDALRAARSKETPVKSLIGRMKTAIRPGPETVTITATVEIDGVSHEHHGEIHTSGDPYWAAIAATNTAREDLWHWAWNQKRHAEVND